MHVAKRTSNHPGRGKARSHAAFAVVGVVLVVLSLVIVWRNDGLQSNALSILVVVDLAVLAGLALIAFLSDWDAAVSWGSYWGDGGLCSWRSPVWLCCSSSSSGI